MPYDVVLLACEGSENNQTKSAAQKGFMRDYLNAGGRVFATHYHYTWFKNGPAELAGVANWQGVGSSNPYSIDTSFPKGKAFAEWLQTYGGAMNGQINLTAIKNDVGSVNAAARAWVFKPSPMSVKYFTFNTPIGQMPEKQCGRGVFSDIHVSSGDSSSATLPSGCKSPTLTDQEKALIFLFFDLAACVTPDDKPPEPPKPN
jgi:hypothetical protein